MRFRACIFDIDGTLVLTGGAGLRALAWACQGFLPDVAYPDLPPAFCPHGKTDPLIFRELCQHYAGVDPDNALLDQLTAAYLDRFPAEMTETMPQYRVLPGVHHLLDRLKSIRTILGLGTGNFELSARQKLHPGGLNRYFPFGSFGNDAEDRGKMLETAYRRAAARAEMLGEPPLETRETLVIGDTTRDIAAARSAGLPVLAVATGPQGIDELAGADLAVRDLTDLAVERFLDLP